MIISALRVVVVAALAAVVVGCGSSDDGGTAAPIAVLGAFPAELAGLLEHTTVEETTEIAGRTFRIGRISGVPVVVGMTGIGLLNAAATTRAVLERYVVRGVVMSGVAGSPRRIADVTVPEVWTLVDGESFPAHPPWLAIARGVESSGAAALERCTLLPNEPERGLVCTEHDPGVFVGGTGQSDDSFGDTPFRCLPAGGDVFGCDAPTDALGATAAAVAGFAPAATVEEEPVAVDMESAAVAREAAAHGVPFIAFRAVSDGAGDPLGLPGFPGQFFAYYRLAARNAAVAAAAFLARVGGAD